jgi:cytochrome c oxidase subunit IV
MNTSQKETQNDMANYGGKLTTYFVVYFLILIAAGLQFVIAYQHLDASQRFERMFLVATVEAGLAIMFFMHLLAERRSLLWFVAIFTLFVLATMQYSWPDSFRILVGVPFSKWH